VTETNGHTGMQTCSIHRTRA